MMQFKYHAPWHPLKHVLVGRCYGPEFFEPIANHRIRDSLQKIAHETEEDYQNLISVLNQHNVLVDRPLVDTKKTIMDFIDSRGTINFMGANSATLIPRPPMQPRDSLMVAGEICVATNWEARYFLEHITGSNDINVVVSGTDFDAPMVNVIGDTLIVDSKDNPNLCTIVKDLLPDYKIKNASIGGHNDAVFCVPCPGLVLSTFHHCDYSDTFPGWQVKFIENQSWQALPEWRAIKHSNKTKWWVPDCLDNNDFSNFIDSWLQKWVGYVHETVFDINMLQIDQNTILVNNYNEELFATLKQHHIDATVVPFRHRFFWDGGLHCITSDLYREGSRDSYV